MKRTIIILLACIYLQANGQFKEENCSSDFAAISVGYAFPNSVVAGADYFTNLGLVGGIGTAYTFPESYNVKVGENTYQMQSNSFDIYAYVGWRLLRVDYVVSVFGNVGYTMGDVEKFQPFTSIKVLFPIGYKAVSFEPVYIFGRGFAPKLSIHFKL